MMLIVEEFFLIVHEFYFEESYFLKAGWQGDLLDQSDSLELHSTQERSHINLHFSHYRERLDSAKEKLHHFALIKFQNHLSQIQVLEFQEHSLQTSLRLVLGLSSCLPESYSSKLIQSFSYSIHQPGYL